MKILKLNLVTCISQLIGKLVRTVFWAIISGTSLMLKFYYRCRNGRTEFKFESNVQPVRIGFCENGAGYGGAVISLVAFLEKLPPPYEAVIYTSIGTERYAQLSVFGRWHYMPPVRLVDTACLSRMQVPLVSLIDNFFNLLPYAIRYYFALKRDKVELVYLNNNASCGFAATIAAKLARLPLVLHVRGFNGDTKGNRWVLSKVNHCIAVSNAVRDELLTLGVPAEKCTVVPEGLDLTIFHPRQASVSIRKDLSLHIDAQVITLVGGLVDWKGQDVMLDAAPIIFQKFPKAVIILVGGAYGKDNNFANMIAKRAATPALQSRVRLLGARDDVADILACSDVVVHASTKPEPFGRTFLEGMALGKAVIASNEGGPLDVISHGIDGLLIEPRNPWKLASAIDQLLSNPALLQTLGKNAAAKARVYSIENHASAVSTILRCVRPGETNQPVPSLDHIWNKENPSSEAHQHRCGYKFKD